MSHGGRRLAAIGIAVLAAVLGLAPGVAAARGGPRAHGRLVWTPCHPEAGPRFQCAVAHVPLDYDHPRGRRIALALTRLPATDPAHRIGSLFLNPGGPGGSGVDYVLGAGPELYTDEVRARFDLVGFDPRGVIRSTPLRCFDSPDDWPSTPFPFPITREQELQWIATDRALDRACRRRGGPIMNHMATADVARDLNVLRRLLGDRKLTYAGVSYGSYLGVTYANMFPRRVRAVVVDGVLDPIAWSTGRGLEGFLVPFSTRLHSDVGAQATLREFFRLCDAGGDRCAFSGHAADRFARLARRLREQPIEVVYPDGSKQTVDYTILIANALGAMYDSSSWPDFAQWLATVEAAAFPAARLTIPAHRRPPSQPQPPRYLAPSGIAAPAGIEQQYMNFLESFPGVACSDTTNPRDYRAWSINGALADLRHGYFGRIWTWISSICAEWPGRDRDRYTGPFTRRTANPVLVVGNRFDPATPYAGAVTVHHLLPRSALLTVEAWGHTSLFKSKCADQTIGRYLVALSLPAPGATCYQDAVPFAGG